MAEEMKVTLVLSTDDPDKLVAKIKEMLKGDAKAEDVLTCIHPIDERKAPDAVVEMNRVELRRRSELGVQKYRQRLTRDDFDEDQWLQHLLEELLDAANYVQALKRYRDLRRPFSGKPGVPVFAVTAYLEAADEFKKLETPETAWRLGVQTSRTTLWNAAEKVRAARKVLDDYIQEAGDANNGRTD